MKIKTQQEMTLNQFLARLRKTPRDWGISGIGVLRRFSRRGIEQCPISALRRLPATKFFAVVQALHITRWRSICRAADNAVIYDAKLRNQLLEACGLTKRRKSLDSRLGK